MAKPYIINITNGSGTQNILNDTYTVSSVVNGYNNASILPASINVVNGTNAYNLTIAATGTLTLHITEDGTIAGTPIVGAKLIRCDSNGTTYGNEITTDEDGNALFNNVPYATTDAPLIYYKQTSSDGEHEFDNTLKNTSLIESSQTIEIINTTPALRTLNVTDLNYEGLPIATGNITLS